MITAFGFTAKQILEEADACKYFNLFKKTGGMVSLSIITNTDEYILLAGHSKNYKVMK